MTGSNYIARRRPYWVAPAALFAATLGIRLLPWNRTLVGWDEAILASISSRWALFHLPGGNLYELIVPTPYSYPSLWFWLNGPLVALLGPTPLVWRLVTVIADAGCVAMLYVLGRRIGGRWVGWSAGLLAWAYLFLMFHKTVTIEYLLCLWILLSVYLFLRSKEERRRDLLLWSVFFGSLACFTKYHGVVYHAMLCVTAVAVPTTRDMIKGKRAIPFVATAAALPCVLLAQEALTWHLHGFEKTHIDEVLSVMTWDSYVEDFNSPAFVRPQWHYYLAYCWHNLGPLLCLLGLAGIVAALLKPRRAFVTILVLMALWMVWASVSNPKNARYCLVAVYFFLLFPGVLLERVAQKSPAVSVTLLTVALCIGLWGTAERTARYLVQTANHRQVYESINNHTPEDAMVFTESLCFQHFNGVEPGPIERALYYAEGPDWWRRADVIIMHELAFNLYKAGAIKMDKAYLAERRSILDEWDVLADVGTGNNRVRVVRRP